ncbi:hypothetical protein [Cellulomonas sp. HZM]|uniref:hypothetical protein n=1 Tax=Cellulomonas sp. HZM TaxID=1454010 RepID=UPI0004931F9D|nr:hypothetical protein [Cellulomonas sp. HZM]
MTRPVGQRVRDLRLDRRALRAEQARVGWWRRLVRARIDLAVAGAARPEALGEAVAFQLPLDVELTVPRPGELGDVLAGMDPGAEVGRLDELRALDARLARYEDGVRRALLAATDRLIVRLATDPATTSAVLREPLSHA